VACIFSFEVWGGRIVFFFNFLWFPICSHYVPFKFSMGFSIYFSSSQCVPQHVLLHTTPHFYPIYFGKCCPPLTYIGGPKGSNLILQNRTFYFG
jgi:hypothetical protein